MSSPTISKNKMGIMPVPKLLISMSLPMRISMLVQALYNILDSMFVAQLSEDALTAVSLAFPVQNLMIAVSAGTGVGINSLLSRCLGEKKFDEANAAARNGIFLAILSAIVFGRGCPPVLYPSNRQSRHFRIRNPIYGRHQHNVHRSFHAGNF